MNVGFIYGIQTYPPETGGSIHGYQLAKGLTNRGHHLYSWYYGDEASPYCSHFRGRELFRFLRTIDVLYIRIDWGQLMRWRDPLQLLLRAGLPAVHEVNGLPDELRSRPDEKSCSAPSISRFETADPFERFEIVRGDNSLAARLFDACE